MLSGDSLTPMSIRKNSSDEKRSTQWTPAPFARDCGTMIRYFAWRYACRSSSSSPRHGGMVLDILLHNVLPVPYPVEEAAIHVDTRFGFPRSMAPAFSNSAVPVCRER